MALDLARRTLELVDIASESRYEEAAAAYVRNAVPLDPAYLEGETLFYRTGTGAPLVVLAGHLDTVPAQGNLPGRIADGVVHGLGASDMKGGVAVMVELARWAADASGLGVDLGFLFFGREEIAVSESPLPAFFDTGLVADAQLVVVLEPTDVQIHAGCLGNIVARVVVEGVAAHSARPWTGVNAIDRALDELRPLAGVPPLDVEIDGLLFREVISMTRIAGGIADNVVPGRVEATVNYRFAPGRTTDEAIARLRELAPSAEVVHAAPSAHVAVSSPLARRLIETGSLDVAPKQAWTPVAQFAERGLDAVNFGPGETAYAHKADEQVSVANLERCFETLRRFASG
jgi:succinyl-diaminopimelate desuccinylase